MTSLGSRRRKGRAVDGILLLDKPAGITSNGALQKVKHLFGAAKAGHTGSLDPIATGVLPICFGEATKFSQFLLDADKSYVATLQLGQRTTTGDSEGEVVEILPVPDCTDAEVDACLEGFRGQIEQIPSMYSAIKVDGQPLYKLARQGIEIERKARTVMIKRLALVSREKRQWVVDVDCSKGTYIRSLAEDIGAVLGCGAHVTALRRHRAGPFGLAEALTMEELAAIKEEKGSQGIDQMLQSVSSAVEEYPSITMTALTAGYFLQGQPVQVSGTVPRGLMAVFRETANESVFAGVGEILDDGRIAPKRLVAVH